MGAITRCTKNQLCITFYYKFISENTRNVHSCVIFKKTSPVSCICTTFNFRHVISYPRKALLDLLSQHIDPFSFPAVIQTDIFHTMKNSSDNNCLIN